MGKPSILQRIVEWGMSLLDGHEPVQRVEEKTLPRHGLPERADATIARVRQVDDTSCGVAAAAMFARQSHSAAKAYMFPSRARVFKTHYKDIWRALQHFGVDHEPKVRRCKTWEEVPSDALVKVRWKGVPAKDALHWVVFQRLAASRFRVIDPGSYGLTLTEIDLDACEVLSYSLVTPRTREQGAVRVAPPKASAAKKAPKRAAKASKAKK